MTNKNDDSFENVEHFAPLMMPKTDLKINLTSNNVQATNALITNLFSRLKHNCHIRT